MNIIKARIIEDTLFSTIGRGRTYYRLGILIGKATNVSYKFISFKKGEIDNRAIMYYMQPYKAKFKPPAYSGSLNYAMTFNPSIAFEP